MSRPINYHDNLGKTCSSNARELESESLSPYNICLSIKLCVDTKIDSVSTMIGSHTFKSLGDVDGFPTLSEYVG